MNPKFFGDSYDIVKKALLGSLAEFGPWGTHPMFTHATSDAEAAEFSRFLGVPLITTQVLSRDCDRAQYFASGSEYRSLFLDPDTGIRLKTIKGRAATKFLFATELVKVVSAHPDGLTLTFDQSLARGREEEQVREKLSHFAASGIHGFAYVSHASFIVLGKCAGLVQQAREQLRVQAALLSRRIITWDAA